MQWSSFSRTVLSTSLLCLTQFAFAEEPLIDTSRIEAAISSLETSYGDVASDIDCDTDNLISHRLICQSTDELALMVRLDQMATVYAYENALGRELNHAKPPIDEAFVSIRDACNDTQCLRNALITHTNDALGGESPYLGD